MKYNNFAGLGTALITPFKNNQIDFASYEKLIENQIDEGASYIVVAGSTGESSVLSDEEFVELIKCAVRYGGGKMPVVVGCNASSTARAVAIAENIEKLGANGVMCTTPAYNRPTQEGLIAHYKAVSKAIKLPIIAYTVPARTGVDLTDETIYTLAEIPNIVALKDATSDILKPLRLAHKLGDKLILASGNDEAVLPYIAQGGRGLISVAANIIPKTYVELVNKCLNGEFVEALKIQQNINELLRALSMEPNPIPIKYAAHLMGLCSPEMRLPLCEPSKACKAALEQSIAAWM
jgi:4-hydroxy-tetrahydrodipicolinate synthase